MTETLDYRLVLDGFSDAVVAADERNLIVYVNAAAERLLGWRKEDLVGRPLPTIMPKRLHVAHQAGFHRYRSTHVPKIMGRPIRVPALRQDGSEIDIELTLSSFALGDGRELFVGSLRDLRARVELERQIAEQGRQLAQYSVMAAIAEAKDFEQAGENILHAIGDALSWDVGIFWAVDRTAETLRASTVWSSTARANEFLESSRQCAFRKGEGLPGLVWQTLKPTWRMDVTRDELYQRRKIATAQDLHTALVFPVVCANQPHGVLEFLSKKREEADNDLLRSMETAGFQIGQFLERLLGEERLRESREWLATTLRSIGDAIIATDAEGRIQFLNHVAETLTGWSQAEAQGRPLAEVFRIVGEDTRQPLENPVQKAIQSRQDIGLANNTLLISKDGTERIIEDSGAPILTEGGKFQGVVLCFRDATAKKRAEHERARLYGEAQEAIRLRNDFLSIASHELKTPLTPIQLHMQAIQRSVAGDGRKLSSKRIASKIDTIARQLSRLERLVDDLLDISRINGRRLQIEREKLNLSVVVRDVVGRFAEELRRAQCDLKIEAPKEVSGRWDRLRLDQILSNLLSNAIKFGQGRPIEVVVQAGDGLVRIAVRDHGIGIAPEDQARIFERFERAVQSRQFGGFGLGLWIVRQLVEFHGGTITVQSQIDQGSTFIVELPRDDHQEQSAPTHAPQPR